VYKINLVVYFFVLTQKSNKKSKKKGCAILNKEQNVQECDATKASFIFFSRAQKNSS